MTRSIVPCNGCTLCCENDLLVLHPEMGDDPGAYETMAATNPITGKPCLALKHKPEGGCIYLSPEGCTIWDRAPAICQEFDCRKFYLRLLEGSTRAERQKLVRSGLVSKQLMRAARRRLHTLEAA